MRTLRKMLKWQAKVEQQKSLLLKISDQTERRVINKEKVHSSEKIVSILEKHTANVVKGYRFPSIVYAAGFQATQ